VSLAPSATCNASGGAASIAERRPREARTEPVAEMGLADGSCGLFSLRSLIRSAFALWNVRVDP
jgi:hypothetical protein